MGEPGGERLLREEAGWQRASFLELFFDLVFVFALSQLSLRLINDFSSGHQLLFGEAAPTLLLFLALWILWLSMIAFTSRLHPDTLPAQVAVFMSIGEAIFVAGRALSNSAFSTPNAAGFGLAIVSTVLLWRIYFYRAGFTLPMAITRAGNPVRESVAVAGSHLLMIGGVVLAGVGFELYINEPLGRPTPNWLIAILGGPALFLAGLKLFELQVFGRISRSRPAGLLALGLLTPITWYLPPLAAGAATAVVLAAIVCTDAW